MMQTDDRIGAAVRLADLRRVGFLRQARDDARHAVAHVVRGRVDVAVHVELDVDLERSSSALRGELVDALDAGDLVLDDLRDLASR